MDTLLPDETPRRCPACGTAAHLDFEAHPLTVEIGGRVAIVGDLRRVVAHVAHCPACDEVLVYLEEGRWVRNDELETGAIRPVVDQRRWVRPAHPTRTLPDEIDETHRADFAEAERVLPVSPNASAALARRLLQRVIREVAHIKPDTLFKEIEALIAEKEPPADLAVTLGDIRGFGNTAAHPELDSAGLVFDVTPAEAAYTLDAVEQVLDWLVVRPRVRENQRAGFEARRAESGVKPLPAPPPGT